MTDRLSGFRAKVVAAADAFCGMKWLWLLAALLALVWSLIIPPFKSVDEQDHVRRAYLLLRGQIMLETNSCTDGQPRCRNGRTMSGGYIDQGLENYLAFRERQNAEGAKITLSAEQEARKIMWAGHDVFATTPGTAYYFPLVYVPQTIGLGIGKALNIPVHFSYYLARIVTLISTALVLALAFRIYSPSFTTLAILLLPMSMFQVVSNSLDPFSSALSVLAIACFQRVMKSGQDTPRSVMILMASSLFVVATTRAHLISMLLLPFVGAWASRKKWVWVVASVIVFAVLVWMAVALPSAVDFRIQRAMTTGQVASAYLHDPAELIAVLNRTLSDYVTRVGYWMSFIGAFMGVPVPFVVYDVLSVLLGGIVLLSLAGPMEIRQALLARGALLLCGMSSIFLVFLALLVSWNDYPAQIINGVQGRYFLIPVMMVLLAVSRWSFPAGWRRALLVLLLWILFAFGFATITHRLLASYYMPWTAQNKLVLGKTRASQPLHPDSAIPVRFEKTAEALAPSVNRIGVLLATYQRKLTGQANIAFLSKDGAIVTRDFSLDDVRDNEYMYFDLPASNWVAAEIVLHAGEGGLSVWEYEPAANPSSWQSCVSLMTEKRSRMVTSGCVGSQ